MLRSAGTATQVAAAAFPLLAPDGSAGAPSYSFSSVPSTGFFWSNSATTVRLTVSGVVASQFFSGGIDLLSNASQLRIGAAVDTAIGRNAAGVLEINNGTAGVFRDLIARSLSGQANFSYPAATVSQTTLGLNGISPTLVFVDSSRTANNRISDFVFVGGVLSGRLNNDSNAAQTSWISIAGGQALGVTSVLFGGTSATLFGVNGAAGQATRTGFGTPTGTGVVANFPGATATLAQTSQAVAQIIADLKALGFYGA